MQELAVVRKLSDDALILDLDRSVREDRRATVRVLVHMGEVDARGLFRDRGYSSMFDYAVRKLHMSDAEAALRIRVARLGRKFPEALEMLERGELHLTALHLLAPVLKPESIGLLQQAHFQTKQGVLELLARHAPKPDVPSSIRRLPTRKPKCAPPLASTTSDAAAATAPAAAAMTAWSSTAGYRSPAHAACSSAPPPFAAADAAATDASTMTAAHVMSSMTLLATPVAVPAQVQASAFSPSEHVAPTDRSVHPNSHPGRTEPLVEPAGEKSAPQRMGPSSNSVQTVQPSRPAADVVHAGVDLGSDEFALQHAVPPSNSVQTVHPSCPAADVVHAGVDLGSDELALQHAVPPSNNAQTVQPSYPAADVVHAGLDLGSDEFALQHAVPPSNSVQTVHPSRAAADVVPATRDARFETHAHQQIVDQAREVRSASARVSAATDEGGPVSLEFHAEEPAAHGAEHAHFRLSMPASSSAVVPLSPARYKVTFTASQRVRDKMEEAQELLRHQLPSRDLESLFERALDSLISQEKKQRLAQSSKPRKVAPARRTKRNSRHISNAVRRSVWARDGGRCCFSSPDGTRCDTRSFLEFHHIEPFARGGASSAENLTLLCRSHNALLAERDYGREYIVSRRARATDGLQRADSLRSRDAIAGQSQPPTRATDGLQRADSLRSRDAAADPF